MKLRILLGGSCNSDEESLSPIIVDTPLFEDPISAPLFEDSIDAIVCDITSTSYTIIIKKARMSLISFYNIVYTDFYLNWNHFE